MRKFSWLILVLILLSCKSVHIISVWECVPPAYPIPNKIQSIALLNRSMTGDFINFKTDSISVEKRMGNNNVNFTRNFSDSIAADSLIMAAAKSLFRSERFDVTVPVNRNITRKNKKDARAPINPELIKEMCRNYGVDGILVLENFSQRVGRRIKGFAPMYYLGLMRVGTNSKWRFYSTGMEPIELNLEGTEVWESYYNPSLNSMYRNLPTIKTTLTGGATELGLRIGYQFIPDWENCT